MKIHFVGIGGIGMSSLALHSHFEGKLVYGSDLYENEQIRLLQKLGVKVFLGHSYNNWLNPDLVVYTPAVHKDNPEISRAKEEHVPVINRFEFLRSIVQRHLQYAVTGSDGKTTTTAMLAHVLKTIGENPTVFLGGLHTSLEYGNYRKGCEKVVYELDESQPEFCNFSPNYLIITNARGDHMENFKSDPSFYKKCFENLVLNTKDLAVTYREDETTGKLGHLTFGKTAGVCRLLERKVNRLVQAATIELDGKKYELILKVPGEHNVLNAMAVITLLWAIGHDVLAVIKALESFVNTYRRFTVTVIDEERRIFVVDDYAHTPDEIQCLLKAAQERFPNEKKVVVFQPHRYTRLAREDGKFSRALELADEVYVTEVYDAFEVDVPKISSKIIVEGLITSGKKAFYVPSLDLVESLLPVTENTVYLFVGAGDVIKASQRFVQTIKKKN
ncbi:UDP-N-acetylmuramate--L-alanine ligase [Pseudothermotoga thermarum]|uniref:UDP-N-acetylmuramate--L-alanine ligase n=1 Tax=Pseudothermotoga thermarum DSM 5069 TaxID=688269 RepID=F7YXX2_9THEM|nr:UDP-N-acetylmuramate--L-alanine ligase [Pseudothermotoga thermarum]AEH50771.1 UDP-N-acetylmuramate--L-alanine ligase [Pseudothermotoga thermarum DSM 5069]